MICHHLLQTVGRHIQNHMTDSSVKHNHSQKTPRRTMPKCRHCKKPVALNERSVPSADCRCVSKKGVGEVKKEIMYSCLLCDCVLGFAVFLGGVLTGRA